MNFSDSSCDELDHEVPFGGDMSNKRQLLLGIVAGSVALGLGATVGQWGNVALALFGVAGLAAFVWIALWARTVNRALAVLQRRVKSVVSTVKRLPSPAKVEDLTRELAVVHDSLARIETALREESPATRRLLDEVRETMMLVQRVPSATVELGRVYDQLVAHNRPMPELGNWAMSPRTLVWVVDHIRETSVQTIVECGSGSSTVWFASAFERRGGPGRIVSLESSAEFAEVTRSQLAELGLSHRADVIHAPLVDTVLPGREPQPWYDLTGLPTDLTAIDLLFVDGPVGAIAPEIRYPGFPALAERLQAGSRVILDDTGRPDETRIAEQWLEARPAGRRLRLTHQLDRSLVFEVDVELS